MRIRHLFRLYVFAPAYYTCLIGITMLVLQVSLFKNDDAQYLRDKQYQSQLTVESLRS